MYESKFQWYVKYVNYAKIVHLFSVISVKNIFVLNVSDPTMVYIKIFDNKHNKLVNQEIAANNVLEIVVMNTINIYVINVSIITMLHQNKIKNSIKY